MIYIGIKCIPKLWLAPLGLGHKILCPPLSSQFSDLLDLRDPETAGGIKEATAEKKTWNGAVALGALYIYQNRELLLAPVVKFAKPVTTRLWAVWADQHARYTWFLSHTSQEGNDCTTTKEKLRYDCTNTNTVAGRRHDWTH